MDAQLLQFLNFMHNEVMVDADVFDRIKDYIKSWYGDNAPKGGFMDVYSNWYKENIE